MFVDGVEVVFLDPSFGPKSAICRLVASKRQARHYDFSFNFRYFAEGSKNEVAYTKIFLCPYKESFLS